MLGEISALQMKTGWCTAGRRHFAEWLQVELQTITYYTKKLEQMGFLEIDRAGYSSNKMRVNPERFMVENTPSVELTTPVSVTDYPQSTGLTTPVSVTDPKENINTIQKLRERNGEKKSPPPPAPVTENQEADITPALEAKKIPIPHIAPAPLSPRHSDKPQNLETDTDLFKQIGEYYKANAREWTDGVCQVLPGRYNNIQLKSMLEEYAGYAFAWKNKYATFAQHHAEFKRWVKRQPTMQKEQPATSQADPTKGLPRYS